MFKVYMMNATRELDRIYMIKADRAALDSVRKNYTHHALSVIRANTEQAQVLEKELSPAFAAMDRWKSDIAYLYLKPAVDDIRLLSNALKEKRKELGMGRSPKRREKKYPSLARLEKLYAQVEEKAVQPKIVDLPKKRSSLEMIISDIKGHPMQRLQEFYSSKGLVGEEATCILQTLGAINRMYFGIESMSGSGKSYTIDILVDLLGKGRIYQMQLSSKTAEFYNAHEINRADIIYIPELQKAMDANNPIMIELLKNLTEGKDAERVVRNQGQNKRFVIESGKGIIFTLATENRYKYDAEFSRRVFILGTDISPEQTDRILDYKARQRHAVFRLNKSEDFKDITSHVQRCMDMKFEYENPFADAIAGLIPRTIRARSYDSYFLDLIEASAKLNHPKRLHSCGVLHVNLEDVYTIHRLYWDQFISGLYRIPPMGSRILSVVDKELSAQDVYLRMYKTGASFGMVEAGLEQLCMAGFLRKDDYKSRKPSYSVLELPQNLEVDWQQVWDCGMGFMSRHYPDVAARWAGLQARDGSVAAYDPIRQKEVAVCRHPLT